jgi:predicted transposase YbfD/YdcC
MQSWPGLKGVVIVESCREISGKIERETRYYITSMSMTAVHLGHIIRSHWAIESAPQAHEQGGSYDLTDCAQAA